MGCMSGEILRYIGNSDLNLLEGESEALGRVIFLSMVPYITLLNNVQYFYSEK